MGPRPTAHHAEAPKSPMSNEIAGQGMYDRRVVERNIKKGVITREGYEQFVKSLVDVGDNAEEIAARMGEEEGADGAEEDGGDEG